MGFVNGNGGACETCKRDRRFCEKCKQNHYRKVRREARLAWNRKGKERRNEGV